MFCRVHILNTDMWTYFSSVSLELLLNDCLPKTSFVNVFHVAQLILQTKIESIRGTTLDEYTRK